MYFEYILYYIFMSSIINIFINIHNKLLKK